MAILKKFNNKVKGVLAGDAVAQKDEDWYT